MCAEIFMSKKDLWAFLVPQNDNESTNRVQEFFACVAALMSIQLRSMVINSLADFLEFFKIHQVSMKVCGVARGGGGKGRGQVPTVQEFSYSAQEHGHELTGRFLGVL